MAIPLNWHRRLTAGLPRPDLSGLAVTARPRTPSTQVGLLLYVSQPHCSNDLQNYSETAEISSPFPAFNNNLVHHLSVLLTVLQLFGPNSLLRSSANSTSQPPSGVNLPKKNLRTGGSSTNFSPLTRSLCLCSQVSRSTT